MKSRSPTSLLNKHMKVTLNLNCTPFSINKMSFRDKRYKTPEAQKWSKSIFIELNSEENQSQLELIRTVFDPKKHAYNIDMQFFYPPHILFTKAGLVSAKSHDLSNVEKPLIDLLFLPKYFDLKVPYGVKNLNVDDKYILNLSSSKRISNNHKIIITLSILELNNL